VTVDTPEHHWRNAPVVRERDVALTRRLSVVLLWMAVAVAPFTFYLVQQMEYVRVRYKIEELRAQHDRLVEAEQRLRIERAGLTSPARVERSAIRELNLVNPPPTRVVVIPRGRLGSTAGSDELLARAPDQP
jgi:cell division protein FtsL